MLTTGLAHGGAETQVVFLAKGLKDRGWDVAVESMMQLGSVYGGRMDERKKWGYHLMDSWKLFFDTGQGGVRAHMGSHYAGYLWIETGIVAAQEVFYMGG